MKEVYTVTYYHEQLGPMLIGIFSTLDRAQDHAEEYIRELGFDLEKIPELIEYRQVEIDMDYGLGAVGLEVE